MIRLLSKAPWLKHMTTKELKMCKDIAIEGVQTDYEDVESCEAREAAESVAAHYVPYSESGKV